MPVQEQNSALENKSRCDIAEALLVASVSNHQDPSTHEMHSLTHCIQQKQHNKNQERKGKQDTHTSQESRPPRIINKPQPTPLPCQKAERTPTRDRSGGVPGSPITNEAKPTDNPVPWTGENKSRQAQTSKVPGGLVAINVDNSSHPIPPWLTKPKPSFSPPPRHDIHPPLRGPVLKKQISLFTNVQII